MAKLSQFLMQVGAYSLRVKGHSIKGTRVTKGKVRIKFKIT